jgi:hypothetical protein
MRISSAVKIVTADAAVGHLAGEARGADDLGFEQAFQRQVGQFGSPRCGAGQAQGQRGGQKAAAGNDVVFGHATKRERAQRARASGRGTLGGIVRVESATIGLNWRPAGALFGPKEAGA